MCTLTNTRTYTQLINQRDWLSNNYELENAHRQIYQMVSAPLFLQYSVVKYHDTRNATERKKHLFFIFFEWKNGIIEQSNLVYTTTPWNMGAGLCGVFLAIHRGYQLARSSYNHFQKDKRRRTLRKQTLRELRSQKSADSHEPAAC